jgi:parvulin-like peptidyl-prolyl isomerase
MFLETEEKAWEIIDKLNNGEDFKMLAGEFSVEPHSKADGGDFGWLPETINTLPESLDDSVLKDAAFNLQPGTLSEPIYDNSVDKPYGFWIVEVLTRDDERSAHMRGILVGTEQEAIDVKKRIESGADFAELAKELSLDPQSAPYGGDIGWIQETFEKPALWKAALSLDIDTLSDPIHDDQAQTRGGYWVIKVIDKKMDMELSDELRVDLKTQALENWLESQRLKSSVEIFLTDEQRELVFNYIN